MSAMPIGMAALLIVFIVGTLRSPYFAWMDSHI